MTLPTGGLPVSRCVSVLTNRPTPDSKAVEDRSVSVIPLIDLSSSIFCCEIRFKLPDFSLSSMSLYFSSIFSFSFVRDFSSSISFMFFSAKFLFCSYYFFKSYKCLN